ncbi:unnamed protein product [Lactuca saligna]|uniref:Uncharacterized protein n=1 Tax=Lactuca saligna TaxID=75948 RepID=A0AA36E300_LACSI|nr:unnamed protein product [Lactuca saligna]
MKTTIDRLPILTLSRDRSLPTSSNERRVARSLLGEGVSGKSPSSNCAAVNGLSRQLGFGCSRIPCPSLPDNRFRNGKQKGKKKCSTKPKDHNFIRRSLLYFIKMETRRNSNFEVGISIHQIDKTDTFRPTQLAGYHLVII